MTEAASALRSAVADVVHTLIATVTRPAGPRPSPSPRPVPRPSPGPPPPPLAKDQESGSPIDVSDELRAIGRTRRLVSGSARELLDRIPDTSRNQDVRAFLQQTRRWAEGGMETIPVVPRRLRSKIARGGPRFSRLGTAISLLTNLAEGDDLPEAAEDTARATVFGWMGEVIATFTGPFRIVAGAAYADFGANYDDYAAANRKASRNDPVLRAQRKRYRETGYAYRCDQYDAMGFKTQDTNCEP